MAVKMKYLHWVNSVEKLDSSGNSIIFSGLDQSNLLFLLSNVSAGTPLNLTKGSFSTEWPN